MAATVYRGDLLLKPLKWYRSLHTGKSRRQENCFIIEGVKAVQQVVTSHPDHLVEIIISESCAPPPFTGSFPCRTLSQVQFATLCTSVTPQGIAAVLRIPQDVYSSIIPENPGNVGTIIRTAAAFGFSGVLLSGNSADPFSSKVVQASAGALFVPWIRRHASVIDMVKELQAKGYRLYCAELGGGGMLSPAKDEKVIIVLGNEGAGISAPLLACADVRYTIPMNQRAVESLNVGVAGAISLFTVYQQGAAEIRQR